MSEPSAGAQSVTDVFDRIADAARAVHEAGQGAARASFSQAEPITVTRTSRDGGLTVTVTDGRVEHLGADSQALEERSFVAVARDLVVLANEALEEHEQKNLEELSKVQTDFGALVGSLGHLQADLRAAFMRDVDRLGN